MGQPLVGHQPGAPGSSPRTTSRSSIASSARARRPVPPAHYQHQPGQPPKRRTRSSAVPSRINRSWSVTDGNWSRARAARPCLASVNGWRGDRPAPCPGVHWCPRTCAGACTACAGPNRPVPPGPLRIQRRVSSPRGTQVAGQTLRVGSATATPWSTSMSTSEFHVYDQSGW